MYNKKSMAIILVVCMLFLPLFSIAPFTGKIFGAVAWVANANRNVSAVIAITGEVTAAGYATLAIIAGASTLLTAGIGLGVSL